MKAHEALATLSHVLITAPDEVIQAIDTILRKGAGLRGPRAHKLDSQVLPGLVPERRKLWFMLADVLRNDCVGIDKGWDDDAEWHPVYAGQCESVLVTHILEANWKQIGKTAAELSGSHISQG